MIQSRVRRLAVVLTIAAGAALAGCATSPGGSTAPVTTTPVVTAPSFDQALQLLQQLAGAAINIECGAAPTAISTAGGTVINVVAPSSDVAKQVLAYLQANQQVAAALCPLYKAVVASVQTPGTTTPQVVGVTYRHGPHGTTHHARRSLTRHVMPVPPHRH